MSYATVADLEAWLDPTAAPTDAAKRLARASGVVDEMLLTSVYTVDDYGQPTDSDVAVALRDATCAQAEYAGATGDPASVGAAGYSQMSIGSVSLTRATRVGGATEPSRYSPTAWSILQRAGLVPAGPYTS